MKTKIFSLFIMLLMLQTSFASGKPETSQTSTDDIKQEIINLSKQKWQWMAEKNVDALNNLFHDEAVFVHMGVTMTKEQELDTVGSGRIEYKKADSKETVVRKVGNVFIVLDRISLTAGLGGNDVVNPFVVTEVYVKIDGSWKLGSMSFTRQTYEYELNLN